VAHLTEHEAGRVRGSAVDSESGGSARSGSATPDRPSGAHTHGHSTASTPGASAKGCGAPDAAPMPGTDELSPAAKILLGGADRNSMGTEEYLASLLDSASEISRVGKGLGAADVDAIARFVLSRPLGVRMGTVGGRVRGTVGGGGGTRCVSRLFLSGNPLGPLGACAAAALLASPDCPLRRLDLRHCALGDEGALSLVAALAGNASLTRLDISSNGRTRGPRHALMSIE